MRATAATRALMPQRLPSSSKIPTTTTQSTKLMLLLITRGAMNDMTELTSELSKMAVHSDQSKPRRAAIENRRWARLQLPTLKMDKLQAKDPIAPLISLSLAKTTL